MLALLPMALLNLFPYLGPEISEFINHEKDYYDAVYKLSLIFLLFLVGIIACIKCLLLSKMIITRFILSLFLLFYLFTDLGMIYLVVT